MALVDCLKKNSKNFSSIEQEKLVERSNELQEQGMSQQEADRFVIDEIADEMRTKFNNIKKQIKLPLDDAPKDDFSEIEKAINEKYSKPKTEPKKEKSPKENQKATAPKSKKDGFVNALKKYSDIDPATPEIVVLKFFALNGRVKFDDVKRSSGYKKADTFGFTGDGPKSKSYHQLYEMALEQTGMDEIDQSEFGNMIDSIIQGGKKKVFKRLKEYIDNPIAKEGGLEDGYEDFLKGQPDNSYLDEMPSDEQADEWFNELTDQEKQELYDDNEKAFSEGVVGIPDAGTEKQDNLGEEAKGLDERDRGREKEERLKILDDAKASAVGIQENLSKAERELRKLQEGLAENLNANQIDAFGQNKPQDLFNDKADQQKIVDKKKKEVEQLQADLKTANQKVKDLEQAIDQNNLFDDNENEDLPDWVTKSQLAESFDGRTQRQVDTASRRLGKVALDRILNTLKAKFPNFKVFTSIEEFKKAYDQYKKDGIIRQIIGEKGAKALDLNDILEGRQELAVREQNREIADEMYAKEKNDSEVFAATGWQKAKDGKMRFEIDYGDFTNIDNLIKEITTLPDGDAKYIGKLKDVFSARELYNAYPEIAEISVILTADPKVKEEASYDPALGQITINAGKINRFFSATDGGIGSIKEKTRGLRGLRRVIAHEAQHAVQQSEGFAKGGNPRMLYLRIVDAPKSKNFTKETLKQYVRKYNSGDIELNNIPKNYVDQVLQFSDRPELIDVAYDESLNPYEKYERLYGEIEARNAQRRSEIIKEDRATLPPNNTEETFDKIFLQSQGPVPNAFVYRDRIYINPELVRADTPIHEFGHIWNALAKIHNKALWRQGETLIKNSVYEKAVRDNPGYAGLTDAQVYDEALAMAIGEKGALLASKSKFNQFFRDLFAWVKQKLGIKSELDFANMTLDDYVNMVAKELLTPGEISFLSDVRLPETATFRLKNYKTPQDAYKAYQERELINQVAAADKDQWKMAVDGMWRRRFNAFMEGVQDQTRRIKEIQNSIVDYHVKLTIENIKADPTLKPKEKYSKIDALKNKRPAVERALLPISQDPHSLLDIMTGKVQYKINQIRDKYLGKPTGDSGYGTILDFLTQDAAWNGKTKFDENSVGFKLKQEGLSLLDLGFYGYVRHAEARNTKVNERRAEQGLEPLERASGMTQVEINSFNKQIDKSGKRDVLEKAFQELRADLVVKPLQMKLEEGIIDQETYDRMIDYYGDTYVPLNVEEAALAGKDTPIGRLNKGVFGSNIKAIKGTDGYTYEDRINPFLQLIYNYEKTIADIERNKAIKAMAELIKQYPDGRIWDTKAPKYDIKLDDNGEVDYVKQFPDAEIENYGVPYMENGKRRYVVLKDDRLREIFMRSSSKRNEFLDLITSMTRGAFSYLRLAFTGLNPNFTFPNLIRDLQDAMVNLSEYSGIDKNARFWKGVRAKVVRGIGPGMKAVWQFERDGTISGEYGQAYQEMKESGGDIAWLDYNSAEQFYKDTKAEVDKFLTTQDTKGERATNIGLMPLRAMLRYTLLANKSAEMGIRLSTYKTIRDLGGSPEMAALAAKNVTVNFNKKGSFNPILSSLYLFLNAGVQGSTRLLTSLSRSKQSRYLVASGIVASIALRYMLDAVDEDEEDKRADRLTKKDFAENAIFPSPFDKDDVIKIPISYNMRPFKAVGDGFYDVYKGRQTPSEAVANVVSTFISGLVPIIESQGIPTLAQPFAEISMNKRLYNDTPISPAKDFNLKKKDSEKYFKNPTGLAMYISEHLADVNSSRDDVLEISPNTIDYVFDWTLGGLKSWYKTGDNIAKTFEGPNKFDINNTFVVSRLYADLEKQDWRDQVNYYALYEKSVRDNMTEENFLNMMKFGSHALDKGLISKSTFNRNKASSLRIQKDTYGNDYKQKVKIYLDENDN